MPARWPARDGRGLENRTGDCPGEHVRGRNTQFRDVIPPDLKRAPTCGGRKYGIPVERRMRGIDGSRQSVLGHDREFFGLSLGQCGVGRDKGNRRVLAYASLHSRGESRRRHGRGKTISSKFSLFLERSSPEVRAVAHNDAPAGVHRNQSPDRVAPSSHCRRRAEATLSIDRGSAEPGTGGSEREGPAGGGRGGIAGLPIRRKTPPPLLPPV